MNVLRDPVWQSIGAALALIAIIATIVVPIRIYKRERSKKELSYEVISETSLLTVHEDARKRIRILLDDREIKDAHLIVLKISNTGNIPVIKEDYDENLSLTFSGTGEAIETEIIEKHPANLRVSIETSGNRPRNKIDFKRALMNPGDSFTVKLIITGLNETVKLDGRIVGGQIVKLKERISTKQWVFPAIILAVATITNSFLLLSAAQVGQVGYHHVVSLFVLVVASLFLILGVLRERSRH